MVQLVSYKNYIKFYYIFKNLELNELFWLDAYRKSNFFEIMSDLGSCQKNGFDSQYWDKRSYDNLVLF